MSDFVKDTNVSYEDTISRQAAIDAIMGQPPEPHYPAWYAAQIEKLPAAQPDRDVIDDCLYHIYKNISTHTATGDCRCRKGCRYEEFKPKRSTGNPQ